MQTNRPFELISMACLIIFAIYSLYILSMGSINV